MATDTPPAPKSLQRRVRTGDLRVAEQALDLALLGRVALLHLCAAGGQRLGGMALGRTGGTAAAVPSGGAAQQDYHIAGSGNFPYHSVSGSSAHDSAHFHALGYIAGVIYLCHMTGSQTDLVSVGAVTGRSGGDDLALGQLAGQGLGKPG